MSRDRHESAVKRDYEIILAIEHTHSHIHVLIKGKVLGTDGCFGRRTGDKWETQARVGFS